MKKLLLILVIIALAIAGSNYLAILAISDDTFKARNESDIENAASFYTADPCGSLAEAAIFYNSTADVFCFCNGSAADLRFDNTTACF